MSEGRETLRFPAEMDHAAIVGRLAGLREAGRDLGLAEFVAILADVETMTPAQLGLAVLSALGWLQARPEHGFMAKQMQMIAMNLKNLK